MNAPPRRLAYLGTPAVAVPPLEALVAAGHQVAVVVTRPDRRRGRGGATSPSPVKAAAEAYGIPVVHDHRALLRLAEPVDLGVVVAYGRIVPAEVLAAVPMVNLHFSLLPRWRGAAPVERALLAGDRETGVCLMRVDEGLDTGPVYAAEATPIGDGDDLGSLRQRLVAIGCRLLVDTLAGPLPEPRPQEGGATYADKVDPAELALHWSAPAEALARVVRLGRAWTTFRGRRLGVLRAVVASVVADEPGTLRADVVATGEGGLRLLEVQPEGKRPMPVADWLRGVRPSPGEHLGE